MDPTRLLYHWEQALELDYAVLGSIDINASAELDAETVGPVVTAAYTAAGIDLPPMPQITVLAPRCVWRITGTDVKHLLRSERGSITVIEEAYGHRTVGAASLEHRHDQALVVSDLPRRGERDHLWHSDVSGSHVRRDHCRPDPVRVRRPRAR